jgi:hypothetical protein
MRYIAEYITGVIQVLTHGTFEEISTAEANIVQKLLQMKALL